MNAIIVNRTEVYVGIFEGNAGVFKRLAVLKAGEYYRLRVDANATYREYLVTIADEDDRQVGQVLTSNDISEYSIIEIKGRKTVWIGLPAAATLGDGLGPRDQRVALPIVSMLTDQTVQIVGTNSTAVPTPADPPIADLAPGDTFSLAEDATDAARYYHLTTRLGNGRLRRVPRVASPNSEELSAPEWVSSNGLESLSRIEIKDIFADYYWEGSSLGSRAPRRSLWGDFSNESSETGGGHWPKMTAQMTV